MPIELLDNTSGLVGRFTVVSGSGLKMSPSIKFPQVPSVIFSVTFELAGFGAFFLILRW